MERKNIKRLEARVQSLDAALTKERRWRRIHKSDSYLQSRCLSRIHTALGKPAVILEGISDWTTYVIRYIRERKTAERKLKSELDRLKERIMEIVTQPLDDLCWRDIYIRLAGLVGVRFNPDMLPRSLMLSQCDRFIRSLKGHRPYETDDSTALVHRLLAERAEYRRVLEGIATSGGPGAGVIAAEKASAVLTRFNAG